MIGSSCSIFCFLIEVCTERYTLLGSGMCDAECWGDTCCPLLSFDWLVPEWKNVGFAFTRKDSLGSFALSPVFQQEEQQTV